tara:strand:- start:19491 stop:20327 length:837 start_codon:yes stop_codon:yes gene_type:complete
MALIPKRDDAKFILNDKMSELELPRPYLGMSGIGQKCHRKLQYDHYWCYKIAHSARIKRLFQVGHDAEPKLVAEIEQLGYTFHSDQLEVTGTGGHWKGHIDGVFVKLQELPHRDFSSHEYLAEFKTHNDKSFKDLKKLGVKKSKPLHFDQCTSYSGYLNLEQSKYVAYNKNDSEIYVEDIPFDKERFKELKSKEAEVIMAEVLLPKIGNGTSNWFECKMCDARATCHKGKLPPVTCRTCRWVDVLPDGIWACSKTLSALTVDEQKEACGDYLLGDMFK